MSQLRKTNTKWLLKTALTQLLQTKRFETISISQIAQKAGVNRGTFYLHYQDKYDMIDQLKEDTLEQIFSFYTEKGASPHEIILKTLYYIKEDFDFIAVLSKSTYVNFSELIKEFTLRLLLQEERIDQHLEEHYRLPLPFAREVFLASLESIITYWIDNGASESPEEVTQMILTVANMKD